MSRRPAPAPAPAPMAMLMAMPMAMLIAALSALLCLPFVRLVAWLGDEGVFLHAAERLLRGERLYRDFFAFLPPGSYLLTAGWMGLGGTTLLSARVLAVATLAGIAALAYAAAALATGRRALPAALALVWVVASQGDWTVVNHHWFTTLFSLGALVPLLLPGGPRPSPWPALASGAAAGTAAMMTQTRGALCAGAALLLLLLQRRPRREVGAFALGGLLAPALSCAYLLAHGTLGDAVRSVVLFTGRHYAGIQWVPFGYAHMAQNEPLLLVFPLGPCLLAILLLREGRGALREPALRAAAAFAAIGLIGCYPRPDIVHVSFCAPLGLPLLALGLQRLGAALPRPLRLGLVAACALALLPAVREYLYAATRAARIARVQTARGPVLPGPALAELPALLAPIAQTPPGDGFFFYPYTPLLPFLTARRHVAPLDIFTPGWTQPEQYAATCVTVLSEARWVVIDVLWTDPKFLKNIWPALSDPDPPSKRRLEAALRGAYDLVGRYGGYELRRRRDASANAAACR